MALLYNVTSKKNLQKPEEPNRNYLILKTLGIIETEELCQRLSINTGIDPNICMAVMNGYDTVITTALTTGHNVRLGNIGIITMRMKSDGKVKLEDVSPALKRNINVNFRINPTTQKILNATELISVESLLVQKKKVDTTEQEELKSE